MDSAHSREAINLARIDLVSMRLAVLCAEHGSLTIAASLTHVSVSGASHRIRSFEDALETVLFDRHRRGLRLTERGDRVIALCREILLLTDKLVA